MFVCPDSKLKKYHLTIWQAYNHIKRQTSSTCTLSQVVVFVTLKRTYMQQRLCSRITANSMTALI